MIGAGSWRCHYARPSPVVDRGGDVAARRLAVVCCSAGNGTLEPFSRSRSKIDRMVKDPPFLQKTENSLSDYCSKLEGDESYSCWTAYFELKHLEEEMSRDDVEKFVREAGGNKSLIDCLHGLTAVDKIHPRQQKAVPVKADVEAERPFPVPDGLPPTAEELEEEEKAKMPDSPFTRLLRRRGKLPDWYSKVPDHETD
ncbi:maternal effect embryo arrest 14 [Wolffia australiana]